MRCSAYYSSRARAWPRCILGKRNLPRVGLATSPTRPAMPVCFPTTQLGQEKIGEKTTVHDLFDRSRQALRRGNEGLQAQDRTRFFPHTHAVAEFRATKTILPIDRQARD